MPELSKNEDREQRILDAAAELFAHYGYTKTTIDEIAAQAGISKGAVYLHFRSKDDLMESLLERESERAMDHIMARLDNDPQGVTLFNIYRHAILAIKANSLLLALYNRDRRVLGDFQRRMWKLPMFQQVTNFGIEFVQHFQRAGLIKPDVNPEALAYILMALRYGVLNIDAVAPDGAVPPIEEIGAVLGEMLQASFGTEGGNSEEGRKALLELVELGRQLLRQMQDARSSAAGNLGKPSEI